MDIQKLAILLTKDEGIKLDFKQKLNLEFESGKKELAKDICAIANSRGGRGYIIFGIEDKSKKVLGIEKDDFNEEKIQQIVATRIDPPIPISVDTVPYNEVTLGILTIYVTEQRPHQLRENGAFYIRRGSTTDIMRKEEIASMIQETGLLSYELLPVIKASIDELDNSLIEKSLTLSGFNDYFIPILTTNGLLVKERDADEYHPTCGGLMLFGYNPQLFLPHCIIRIHNMLDQRLSSHFTATGTLIEMLKDALDFVKECVSIDDYPYEIIEDSLSKSIINRDYFDINSCIEIYITKSSIEIITPGGILKSPTGNPGRYIRRNMWLYGKLISIDRDKIYFDKTVNIPGFIKKYGKIKYINILSRNIFKVIIPLKPIL